MVAANTVLLQASGPNAAYNTRAGVITADSFGMISCPAYGIELQDLIASGCVVQGFPAFSFANFKNLVDGGDFQNNPWQRGNSITGITNSVTYGPDRFFAIGGASSSISLVKTANTQIAGFTQACAFGRAANNTDTAAINFGQVVESLDSFKAAGQPIVLSFYAIAGANYSGGQATVQINSGTAVDGTAANLITNAWTGNAILGTAGFTPTTTPQRFNISIPLVPAASKQLGFFFSYVGSGTAGAADNILFNGIQLEIGEQVTPFEFRDAEVELALAQRYFFQINEPAAGVVIAPGAWTGASKQTFFIPLPVQMRTAPSVTVSAGSMVQTQPLGTTTAVSSFAAGTTHTANYISVTSSVTGGSTPGTAGQSVLLQGAGGPGTIKATADY
jgi:hypothetical protein